MEKKEAVYAEHTFAPVYDADSKVLILGSFPSVKSREAQFYYAHPQNRFWRVMAAITNQPLPNTVEEKKQFLLQNHIALWDVIQSCKIVGSSDSSIQDVTANDIAGLLQKTKIERLFANGGKAYALYQKYVYAKTDRQIQRLPSTSPANARAQMDTLCREWKCVAAAAQSNSEIANVSDFEIPCPKGIES